ncbi:hypothetical protein HJC23_006263 [Cyclotella cryptica]|uniref:Metaxin glutathione S-transferase domain-containing protein n=1 Tax=Cyclotella cryptica TaxID=29204 RepID=A0ABD3PLD0_9STRA|eukprot:CCRYP_013450-RA/>CCRYP_013450-RA protein AED:0.06 eAED:0.06 QI:0/-1/0/1/-1/1/1/0/655
MPPSAATSTLLFPTSLTNLSSHRHRPPSLCTRQEGWTEVWGAKDCRDPVGADDGGVVVSPHPRSRYVTVVQDGCDYIDGTAGIDSTVEEKISCDHHSLKLTQHRPAWLEQIVLRMCYIPHAVRNSSYSAEESAGALPNLLDLQCGKSIVKNGASSWNEEMSQWTKALSRLDKPVLIGRNHPGGLGSCFYNQHHELSKASQPMSLSFIPSGSHIVDYLRMSHGDVHGHILFEHVDVQPYTILIQEKLDYILLALRYGNDPAWEMVYRPQCIQASLDPDGERFRSNLEKSTAESSPKRVVKSFFSLWTWYQTYSERSLALYNLIPSSYSVHPSTHGVLALELFRYNDHRYSHKSKNAESANLTKEEKIHQHHPFSSYLPSYSGVGGGDSGKVNVYRAMEYADVYYTTLEEKMTSTPETSPYFFGTEKPCYFDALLFAHLAEAICDVYLVLILAKHSRLVQYFQRMYDQYFGNDYVKLFESRHGGNTDWIRVNNFVNACNAFNRIPESIPAKRTLSPEDASEMSHAIQLMQQLAVHCHQLDEALKDAARSRLESGEKHVLEGYHRPMGPNLYKWLLGFWDGKRSDKNSSSYIHEDQADRHTTEDSNDEFKKDDVNRKWKEQMERMERDKRNSDETWVMGVIVAVFATVMISASSRTKS